MLAISVPSNVIESKQRIQRRQQRSKRKCERMNHEPCNKITMYNRESANDYLWANHKEIQNDTRILTFDVSNVFVRPSNNASWTNKKEAWL